jgi:hypothetical protein
VLTVFTPNLCRVKSCSSCICVESARFFLPLRPWASVQTSLVTTPSGVASISILVYYCDFQYRIQWTLIRSDADYTGFYLSFNKIPKHIRSPDRVNTPPDDVDGQRQKCFATTSRASNYTQYVSERPLLFRRLCLGYESNSRWICFSVRRFISFTIGK